MTDTITLRVVDPGRQYPNQAAADACAWDSYISLADAKTYWALDPRTSAAFSSATNDLLSQCLVQAYYRLNRFLYIGRVTQIYQTSRWPRVSVLNINGWVYDSFSIPNPIKAAQCEEAFYLFNADTEVRRRVLDRNLGITRFRAGESQVQYDEKDSIGSNDRFLWSPDAYQLIEHTLLSGVQQANYGAWTFPTQWEQ